MEKSKKEPKNSKEKKVEEKETIVTEAIGLLAEQAQRTLRQELLKAQDSPNPPFFLKKKSLSRNGKTDEDFEKDEVELQNFATVLAEAMAHLLKQAKRNLLENVKKTKTADAKKLKTVDNQKQREDEVRNFSKMFAETRSKLVEEVKDLIRELRKGDGAEEENSPKRSETIFSTIGVDFPTKKPPKRSAPSTSYNSERERDPTKKPRISPTKPGAAKKTKSSRDDVCYICEEKGHWAYQCSKPDKRVCYICNKTGHISRECLLPENRSCYICKKEGHVAVDCRKSKSNKSSRRRRSRSYSRESSRSRSQSYSSEKSETSCYSR